MVKRPHNSEGQRIVGKRITFSSIVTFPKAAVSLIGHCADWLGVAREKSQQTASTPAVALCWQTYGVRPWYSTCVPFRVLPAPPLWEGRGATESRSVRLQTALCSKCSYADVARYRYFRNKLVYATLSLDLRRHARGGHQKHPTAHRTPRRCRSHWICTVTVHQAVIDYNVPKHLNAHQHLCRVRAPRCSADHVETISGGRWPASPRALSETSPLGRTTMCVIEACGSDMRSQASGGSWSARHTTYRITLA